MPLIIIETRLRRRCRGLWRGEDQVVFPDDIFPRKYLDTSSPSLRTASLEASSLPLPLGFLGNEPK